MLWGESFVTTGLKKSSSRLSGRLCCCVSFRFWRKIGRFFVVAGKFYYDRKKKFKSSVWQVVLLCEFLVLVGNRQFFCCGGKVLLGPEKKEFKSSVWWVVLLCEFLVLAGNRQFFCCGRKVLLRPEKKVQVVCLAGCAVVSVFGSVRK